YDVANNDGDPMPPLSRVDQEFQHGTMVAGIASASINDKGIVSVGMNTEVIAIKCVRDDAVDDWRMEYGWAGVEYAIRAGADIINLSLGTRSYMSGSDSAILNLALSKGILVIAAAGNSGANEIIYPAAYD